MYVLCGIGACAVRVGSDDQHGWRHTDGWEREKCHLQTIVIRHLTLRPSKLPPSARNIHPPSNATIGYKTRAEALFFSRQSLFADYFCRIAVCLHSRKLHPGDLRLFDWKPEMNDGLGGMRRYR